MSLDSLHKLREVRTISFVLSWFWYKMCSKVDLWVKTNQLRILEQFMKKSFLRLNGNFAFDRNHLKQLHCCYCYCSSNECICLFIYFHIFKRNDRSRFLENTSERFPAAFKCLSTYLSLSLSHTHTHTHFTEHFRRRYQRAPWRYTAPWDRFPLAQKARLFSDKDFNNREDFALKI